MYDYENTNEKIRKYKANSRKLHFLILYIFIYLIIIKYQINEIMGIGDWAQSPLLVY